MIHKIVPYGTARKNLKQFVPLQKTYIDRNDEIKLIEGSYFKIDGILFAMMNTKERKDYKYYIEYEQTDSTIRGDVPILVSAHDVKLYKPLQIARHHVGREISDPPYEGSPTGKKITDNLAKKLLEDSAKANPKLRDKLNNVFIRFFKEPFEEVEQEIEEVIKNIKLKLQNDIDNDLINITETERTTIINQRIGQDLIRKRMLEIYNNRCAMCNIDNPDLLRASHIIPWSENKQTRLDLRNIILLCGLHDLAFENGLITISNNYKICLNDISRGASEVLNNITHKNLRLPELTEYYPRQDYLSHHRSKFRKII